MRCTAALALVVLVACTDGGEPGPPPGQQVFATDRLHVVSIEVAPAYLDSLENDPATRVPAVVTFDGERLEQVGIRKKGGLGSVAPLSGKTGFSLKLNDLIPGQRLDGLKRLVLNNAQEDATFLSETIGYLAYREAGQAASLTSHAVVTFNGDDKGLFVVKEPIGDDFLERNFGVANDTGNVYEGYYHPEDQRLGDFVTHPEELDLKDEVEDGRSRADIEALAAVIRDSTDAELATALAAHLDLDRYLTGLALDTILGYWDSYAYFLNNYFLYHEPASDRFIYLPHGMDQLQYVELDQPMGVLAQRLRDQPDLNARLDARLAELRAAWPVAALIARIDQVEALLDVAPAGPRTDSDLDSFRSNVADVRAAVIGLRR